MPALGDHLWPSVNQRVDLQLAGQQLSSRVEDWFRGDLVLAAPSQARVAPGQRLRVSWTSTGGPCWLDVVVVEVGERPLRVWRVRPETTTKQIQRRDHVRTQMTQRVHIGGPGASRQGVVTDLSEGGVRVTLADDPAYAVGDPVALKLQVGEAPMIARAEVVRVERPQPGQTDLALRFLDLSHRDADRIRRVVLLQTRDRAGGQT